MIEPAEEDSPVPSPEQMDDALAAFWRGSSVPFDHLLEDEGDLSVCSVLEDVTRNLPDQCLSGPMNEAYTVIREIGRGGMGLVYEARQERTGRNVAIKIMQHAGPTDDASSRMFRREVEILAGLKHPYVATLHDAGQTPPTAKSPGQPFFVMELVEGQPLIKWSGATAASGLTKGKLLHARLGLFRKICEAVSYAHQRGVIHRDLKPGNILVVGEWADEAIPKLLDFGLAGLSTKQSTGGKCVGTPAYMSPEQKEGRSLEVDTRSDVYALGVKWHDDTGGRKLLERAFAIRREACGLQSPQVAESLCGMAVLAMGRALYAESEQWYRQALSIHRQLNHDSRAMADVLRRLGAVLVAGGRFEDAMPVLEEALSLQQKVLGQDHLDVARTLTDIIEIHQHHAEFQTAETLCREQVRILRRAYPDGHKDLAIAISELAALTNENSEFDEAESDCIANRRIWS